MLYEIMVEFNEDFLEISGNKIRIGIRSKPIKGKANIEVIKKLSRYFELPTNKIQIKKGHKSQTKIIEINH